MAQSFGIVEEKLREADFFLERVRNLRPLTYSARFYFSAFLSASRSVTLVLQATMNDAPGFRSWYEDAINPIKADPFAKYFKDIRNISIHKGLNPLNEVELNHLREHLFSQFQGLDVHAIVVSNPNELNSTKLSDAVHLSHQYFRSLVKLIYDCYSKFKSIVDPRWYFTREHFLAMDKTLEDAWSELGFPTSWSSYLSDSEDDGWRALRSQQPPCQINDIFQKYLGKSIADPDDVG